MPDDRHGQSHDERSGMATTPASGTRSSERAPSTYPPEGSGWVLFCGIMLMMVGVLNVVWGIAAIDRSGFFVQDTQYIFSDLRTWGWIVLILGVLQLVAAFSIWAGGSYGRWFGIATATVNAIAALLSIPAYPFWALAIFAVDVLVIYGLATYGGDRRISAG
jgi:hypothetical protein